MEVNGSPGLAAKLPRGAKINMETIREVFNLARLHVPKPTAQVTTKDLDQTLKAKFNIELSQKWK